MRAHFQKLRVRVPQDCVGAVVSKLNRIGSKVRELAQTEPLRTIYVDVPLPEVLDLELWLDQACEGEGRLDIDESADEPRT